MTGLGKFWAKWEKEESGEYQVAFGTPTGTSGVVSLPVLEVGKIPTVVVNGEAAGNGSVTMEMGRATLEVGGGNYTVQITK
jgi:hypothetical protein